MKSWIFLQTYDNDYGLSTNIVVYDKETFLMHAKKGNRIACRFAEVNSSVQSAKHFHYISLAEFNEIFGNDNLSEQEITTICGVKSEVSKAIGLDRHYVNLEPIKMKDLIPGCVYENSDHDFFVFGGKIAKGVYEIGYENPQKFRRAPVDLKGLYLFKQLNKEDKSEKTLLNLLSKGYFNFNNCDVCGTKKVIFKTKRKLDIQDSIDIEYTTTNGYHRHLQIEFKK